MSIISDAKLQHEKIENTAKTAAGEDI